MPCNPIFQGRQRKNSLGKLCLMAPVKKEWSGGDEEKQKTSNSIQESLQLCGCKVKHGELES